MALKKLVVLAGEAAGEKMGLQKQDISEEGGLVAYMTHLALEHPACFATLLGKVMTIQQRDKARGITPDGSGAPQKITERTLMGRR